MINDILTGIPWGIFLSFMIGPVFFILLETSIIKGFRAAFIFDLGVVLADAVFISLAYFGSYRLIKSLEDKPALFIFGGIIMLVYGCISFVTLRKEKLQLNQIDAEITKTNYFSIFIKGFFLNIINIGVLGFWLAVILSVGPKLNMDSNRMGVFFITVISTYLVVDCIKILLAKQLKTSLTPTNILKIKKIISIILMIFGIVLITQGWFPNEKEKIKNALQQMDKH